MFAPSVTSSSASIGVHFSQGYNNVHVSDRIVLSTEAMDDGYNATRPLEVIYGLL